MAEETNVSRRDVLKTASAAGAAAAALRLTGAPAIQKVKAANDRVTYGVIGTGSRGAYLLKHLTGIDNGYCTAICDIKDDALDKGSQTIGTKPERYKDYRELLAKAKVDAVFVVTPLFAHFPCTRDALLAGKHVFCEKSMVFKAEEVHQLRALAEERSKQTLQVGLQRRYSKFYMAARAMVEKGLIGNVTHIRAQWHRNPGWQMKGDPKTLEGRMANWRLFREYSGGLVAELGSHQIDVADWMFGATPEYVMGIGERNWMHDGRDIFDNVQLMYRYPKGQKLIYTSISTSSHLPLFGGERTEFGELIMGTGGSIHITVGDDKNPAMGVWFREPKPPTVEKAAEKKKEEWKAGATMVATAGSRPLPILLDRDQMRGNESFLEKEMKYARLWLYQKGVMLPEEDRNPVDIQLEAFFDSCKTGRKPRADVEIGLQDSIAVILSNYAMDEGRKVYFNEIENMGKSPAAKPAKA